MRPALLTLLAAGVALAAEPKPGPAAQYAVPLAPELIAGKPVKVVLRGRQLDTVKEVLASDHAVKVKLVAARASGVSKERPKEREGDSEVELTLESASPPGDITLTLVGKDGVRSPPWRLPAPFDGPRLTEKEGNDGFRQAQALPLPGSAVGAIGREKDVDVYRVEAKAGKPVRARAECGSLGSPAELMLTVYDGGGRILATANGADPTATATPASDGPLFVALLDARDWGGPGYGYRLTVTAE